MKTLLASPVVDVAFAIPDQFDESVMAAESCESGFRLWVDELLRLRAFESVLGYLVSTMGRPGSGLIVCDLLPADSLAERIASIGIPNTPSLCREIYDSLGVWLDGRSRAGQPHLGAFRMQWLHGGAEDLVGKSWGTDVPPHLVEANFAPFDGKAVTVLYRCHQLEIWAADRVGLVEGVAEAVLHQFREAFSPIYECDGGMAFAGIASVIPVGDPSRV